MNFTQFAESHGLIIRHLVANGKWQRVPTADHPHKKNGAYAYDGERGAVQNWAYDTEPSFYRENAANVDYAKTKAIAKKVVEDKAQLNLAAAKKAGFMLHNATLDNHDYLIRKGFEDMKGYVYENKLLVPMRINNALVGLQTIDINGDKKFIYGQQTSMATHTIGNKGINILCEGYATGLSVFKAVRMCAIDCEVHICFSAGNMLKVSKTLKQGLTIADNDKSLTGLKVAEQIGWDYWISKTEGNDFNDESKSKSYFKLSQELKKMLIKLL